LGSYQTYCWEPENTRTRKPYTCNLTNEMLKYKKRKGATRNEIVLALWLT